MTVRELYDWAKANDALDLDIEIQNCAGLGEFLTGVRDCDDAHICDKENNYNTDRVVCL